jgi:3-oxoadipate enol-lactonase
MFRWLAEPLEDRFRLVVPDLPGHGRRWGVLGPYAAMLAGAIPGARTATIADAGHTMAWTHRDRLAQILASWWDDLDRVDGALA